MLLIDGVKKINVGSHGGKWSEHVRTIDTMGASKVECLDGHGNTIRAQTLIDDDDDDERPSSKPAPPTGCCPTCGVSLDKLAVLLASAYEKGGTSMRDAYTSIFVENTNLVKLLANRLSSVEVSWMRGLQQQAKLITDAAEARAEAAEAADDSEDPIIGALTAGLLQGQQQAAAEELAKQHNGRANGKERRK
jgi:hypothetical protein